MPAAHFTLRDVVAVKLPVNLRVEQKEGALGCK
jgi:hypothetical protein